MALPPAEQILWGTGFENVLDFDYPRALDTPRAWRRPAPGAARARNPAGVTDAAVYGYDYMLAGRARWFGRSDWDNPVGLQAFIDWAGQGNAFRFVPDKTAPDFYVDNCVLDSPFDDAEPAVEEADGSQAIDLVIRNPSVPFGRALSGIMAHVKAGMSLTDPIVATFTRADATTCATRIKHDGTIETVAANVPRIEWVDLDGDGIRETPGILLEGSRTNRVLRSEALSNAAIWTQENTPIVTDAALTLGDLTLSKVEDDSAVNLERIRQPVTFVGDGAKAISVFCGFGNSAFSHVQIYDITVAASRLEAKITWTAGVPSLSFVAGSQLRAPEYLGTVAGVAIYRLHLVTTAGLLAANNNQYFLNGACGSSGFDATAVGYTYFGGAQGEDAAFTSSYIKTVASAVTRAADSFTLPFNFGPMDTTILCRVARPVHADASGTLGIFPGLYALSSSLPRLDGGFQSTSRNFYSLVENGAGSQATVAIPAGAELKHLAHFKNLTTAPEWAVGGNGDVGGFQAGATAFLAYANQTLRIGRTNDELFGVLLELKVASKLRTLTEMLAL